MKNLIIYSYKKSEISDYLYLKLLQTLKATKINFF